MSKELAPCGTEAAYRRHRRHQEIPCDDCKRAAAVARKRRMNANKPAEQQSDLPSWRDGTMAEIRPDLFGGDIVPSEVENLDARTERLWIYATLKSAMRFAMPRETASIAKELRSLLNELTAKTSGGEDEKTFQSEFEEAMRLREQHRAGLSAAQD